VSEAEPSRSIHYSNLFWFWLVKVRDQGNTSFCAPEADISQKGDHKNKFGNKLGLGI